MWCGCFHCLEVYEATDVIDWIDDGETPLCPRCGMDSVMLGVTDLMDLLAMHRVRFGSGVAPRRVAPNRVDPDHGTASDPFENN